MPKCIYRTQKAATLRCDVFRDFNVTTHSCTTSIVEPSASYSNAGSLVLIFFVNELCNKHCGLNKYQNKSPAVGLNNEHC